jgi:HSP20 family protein
MSLMRWDPFADMDTIFNRMLPAGLSRWPRLAGTGSDRKLEWAPSADISETDQEFLIRAELPAVRKEDVQVTLDEGIITIKGERRQQSDNKSEKYHRVESFYGSFERSFALPDNVSADNIRCDSKDGVLTVHIPKAKVQKTEPKQISVQ